MKLPNVDSAVVSKEKVVGYLLNPEHPDGASKARFFTTFGFSTDDWQQLADSLRKVAVQNDVARTVESEHGIKYIVEGSISTPSGQSPLVRIIWIVDRGQTTPRLVTAYPLQPEDEDD
jgi:hypothetical protein